MAHEKLSPRQKMIGMMYLVLTAMLALNVQKEVVKAFMKVDKGLTVTVENYNKKNATIYNDFEASFATYPARTGPWRNKAIEVKQRAEEMFNFIQDLKILIIKTADGEDAAAISGRIIDIEKVEKYDENNIPSEILIAADEAGKAYDLKAALESYKEFLISTMGTGGGDIVESLNKTLNTDAGPNESGDIEPWPNLMFQGLPLVGANALLTKIQVDVRNAETEVLNYLFSQIDKTNFKFNKLEAVVIPKSTFVTLGSNYEASVFLSATDSTQSPTIKVNGGQVLELDESGRGIYNVKASAFGDKKWGGVIEMPSPDGSVAEYKFDASYFVGEANAIVAATAVNVMYTGTPNPVDISIPGYGSNQIRITKVVNGTSSREKVANPAGGNFPGDWAITPAKAGQNIQLFIAAQEPDGRLVNYPPKEFRVRDLPPPIAMISGRSSGSIDMATLRVADGVNAILPDALFNVRYNITAFTLYYTDSRGNTVPVESKNRQFTPEQKNFINQLRRGQLLTITDIKASGPGNKLYELPALILKVN